MIISVNRLNHYAWILSIDGLYFGQKEHSAAVSSVGKKMEKEKESIAKTLKYLQKKVFSNEDSALLEVNEIEEKWKFHKVEKVKYG